MKNYKTFAEMEALLLTAIELPGSSIKDIAAARLGRDTSKIKACGSAAGYFVNER